MYRTENVPDMDNLDLTLAIKQKRKLDKYVQNEIGGIKQLDSEHSWCGKIYIEAT